MRNVTGSVAPEPGMESYGVAKEDKSKLEVREVNLEALCLAVTREPQPVSVSLATSLCGRGCSTVAWNFVQKSFPPQGLELAKCFQWGSPEL